METKIIDGKKYYYRLADKLKYMERFCLGNEDAEEKAINKQLWRIKRLKECGE